MLGYWVELHIVQAGRVGFDGGGVGADDCDGQGVVGGGELVNAQIKCSGRNDRAGGKEAMRREPIRKTRHVFMSLTVIDMVNEPGIAGK